MNKLPFFSDVPANWSALAPHFANLQAQQITPANLQDWLLRWSDLQKIVWEVRAGLKRTRLRDVTNTQANLAWQEFYETFFHPFLTANQALNEKLLAFVDAQGIDENLPEALPAELRPSLRLMRAETALFRAENLPLAAEINHLVAEVEAASGGVKVQIDGAMVTPGELDDRLVSSDSETRKAAFLAQNGAWRDVRQPVNDLFLRILHLRRQLARNAGQPDYRAYRWLEIGRLDYAPEESLGFHEAVRMNIVPIAQKIADGQLAAHHLDRMHPWDQAFTQAVPGNPRRPFADADAFEAGMAPVFHHIDPELGALYERMRAGGYLDLGRRSGKPSGGEEWLFPYTGMPCLRSDADGDVEGVALLLHEMGHAFHDYLVMKDHGLFWMLDFPSEFSELAAITMTYLAAPYLSTDRGGFYAPEDALALQRSAVSEVIVRWLPQIAMVDRFQHWLYAEAPETVTAVDLDRQWLHLSRIYFPWVDGTGFEEELAAGWQREGILFSQPFYQIEYGLAHLGALQIWKNAEQDAKTAWQDYRQALALGSTRPLAQLYEAAGAQLPFDQHVIAGVVRALNHLRVE